MDEYRRDIENFRRERNKMLFKEAEERVREEMLSKMTPQERKRFLEMERKNKLIEERGREIEKQLIKRRRLF